MAISQCKMHSDQLHKSASTSTVATVFRSISRAGEMAPWVSAWYTKPDNPSLDLQSAHNRQMQLYGICNPPFLWENRGGDRRVSRGPQTSGPASLTSQQGTRKTPSQTKWKSRARTQGCSLTYAHTLWSACAYYTHTYEYTHHPRKIKEVMSV